MDLDVVAHDPFSVEHHAHRHAEVFAIDLPLGAVGHPVAHHAGVGEFAVTRHAQGHRPGVALDGQVASHLETVIAFWRDGGALEGHDGVLLAVAHTSSLIGCKSFDPRPTNRHPASHSRVLWLHFVWQSVL
jgi:hypothetical protein